MKLRTTTPAFVRVCLCLLLASVLLAGCATTPGGVTNPLRPEHVTEILPTVPVTEEGFEPYEKALPGNYDRGKKRAQEILEAMQERGVDKQLARFAVAIVFPELTRYSSFRDSLEVNANRASINLEKKRDYSVGEMQMTSSFAVDVERQLVRHDDLRQKYSDIDFGGDDATAEAREARLDRITQRQFQISYLLAFVDVFARMYAAEVDEWLADDAALAKTVPASESIYSSYTCLAFFATAYNAGFMRGLDVIAPFMMRYGFPYGGLDSRSHWNYRTIAQTWFLDR